MADQNKDGTTPIASGLQPGPGENLQSATTAGAAGTSTSTSTSALTSPSATAGSSSGTASTAMGSGRTSDMQGSGSTAGMGSDKTFSTQAIKESGTRIASEAKQYAGDVANRAKEKGRTVFEEQKETAVSQVDNVATAIRSTASQLEGQGQGQVARYVGMVADQLESFSGRLREKDLDSLINDTQNLARRAPGTFLVGSVVAGFLLARFLKSSSEHYQHQSSMPTSATRQRFAATDDTDSMSTMAGGRQPVGADGTPDRTSDAPLGAGSVSTGTVPLNGSRSGGGSL